METNPGINNNIETHSSRLKTFIIEIGIVLILVVVTLVELQYFKIVDLRSFLPGKSPSQSQQASQEHLSNQVNNPDLTLSPRAQTVLQNIDELEKNPALRFVFLVTEFEGKIVSIDTAGGIDKKSSFLYKVRLVINVGKKEATTTILYSKERISKVKIFDEDQNVLTFSDLKPGDRVSIRTSSNVFVRYPNNLNDSVITKLK